MSKQGLIDGVNLDLGKDGQTSSLNAIPLWTVQEVSQYLRLKPETVRAKVRRGELPGIKIGRVWRFKREMIEDWVQVATNRVRP